MFFHVFYRRNENLIFVRCVDVCELVAEVLKLLDLGFVVNYLSCVIIYFQEFRANDFIGLIIILIKKFCIHLGGCSW